MKGHMPRFDGDLAADDVELLAKWVHAHARGGTLRAGATENPKQK
jgi:hypothetical protein